MQPLKNKPIKPAIPSATVILLRDNASSLAEFEVLLLQRNPTIKNHGGAWVFPGGKIEQADLPMDAAQHQFDPQIHFSGLSPEVAEAALKQAACRETMEEARIHLPSKNLAPCARWLTPQILPRRFDTYFYYAKMPAQEVTVDGSEITDYQWITASDALDMHHHGELALPPPTYVSLQHLRKYPCSTSVIKTSTAAPTPFFEPVWVKTEKGFCTLYREDAAYQSLDLNDHRQQHRLYVNNGICQYIKD